MAVSPLLLMLVVVLIAPLPLCVLSVSAPDNQGKEFIFGYMENANNKSDDAQLYISTSSNIPAVVTVSTPLFDPDWSETFNLSRGEVQAVTLPNGIRGAGIEKSDKSVWVQSTVEVSVYAVSYESTGAYTVLPVDVLGKEYYAMTYRKDPVLLLVGIEDNTQVSIKWPRNALFDLIVDGQTYRDGDTLTLTLNKFETMHIYQSGVEADFAGSYITSLKPIAAISGNRGVSVPSTATSSDHLTEMLVPVNTWGTDFISTSTPGRTIGDRYRIVASESDTQVDLTGIGTYNLSFPGDYQELDMNTSNYVKITATKPVLIAMFTKSWENDSKIGGDPAMTLIIPEPQYDSDCTWVAVSTPAGEYNNLVVVIIEGDKKDGLLLDGNSVTWEEEKRVAGSTKVHLWAYVTPGAHNLYHPDPLATFMLYASGAQHGGSYGFLGGMRMADINSPCTSSCMVVGDIVDNDCDGRVDEEVSNGLDDDGDGTIDEDLARPPRTDGRWSDWESWSPCPTACGVHGARVRTRACDNPAPANNGYLCNGSCADAEYCHTNRCPRPREYKTCQLTGGQVDTFGNIQGNFTYNCFFKATSLKYRVAGGYTLKLDIYTISNDTDQYGNVFVSEVGVFVQEVCLNPSHNVSIFTIRSRTIKYAINSGKEILVPEQIWDIVNPSAYKDYMCFDYDNGQVTFSIKTERGRCIQVFTFLPLIPAGSGTPGVVITVEAHKLSRHGVASFPDTLCSGPRDKAFEEPFQGLANTQQKIMYALLDQTALFYSDMRCYEAIMAFQYRNDTVKKAAVEQCESTDLAALAYCITSTTVT